MRAQRILRARLPVLLLGIVKHLRRFGFLDLDTLTNEVPFELDRVQHSFLPQQKDPPGLPRFDQDSHRIVAAGQGRVGATAELHVRDAVWRRAVV